MADTVEYSIDHIGNILINPNLPLKQRFRALFTLRNLGGNSSIKYISDCFNDSSALLKHELAYCLGQMQDERAIPILKTVLSNSNEAPMVRHEAAEALGAIGSFSVLDFLESFTNDPVIEVAETCQLAVARLKWIKDPDLGENLPENPFLSVDPTPPSTETDVEKLKKVLLDDNQSLYERYRAMFALRNLNTKDSVLALAEGLKVGGALFRHEVAFVLGQLQREESIPFLKESLEDVSENEMVRHESAEALGAIATPECSEILQRYLHDEKRVVRESCEIALDICDYESSGQFQYANMLTAVVG